MRAKLLTFFIAIIITTAGQADNSATTGTQDKLLFGPENIIRFASGKESYDTTDWSKEAKTDFVAAVKASKAEPLATLTIARLNIQAPVFNGTDSLTLHRGLGRIIGTARIDKKGNLGIAGHRDSFFRGLKDIKLGDQLSLDSPAGTRQYEISAISITTPDDVSVLKPGAENSITLVTCYPFYFQGHAPKRYIVKAVEIAEPDKREGLPASL